jgi:hypothetical protein
MHERSDGWHGSIPALRAEVLAKSQSACLARLRRAAGDDAVLTIDVVPALVGVAEAAQILGWDRRRVITYVDRGSFPPPVASLASGRVWRRDDVEAFARSAERRHERRIGR